MKMKKIILAFFLMLLFSGCSALQNKIPKEPAVNNANYNINKSVSPIPKASPTIVPGENKNAVPSATQNGAGTNALIRKCPEAWYENQIPGIVREGEVKIIEGYMIIDGKRVELDQVDVKWVGENCQIKKQKAY